MEYDKQKKNDVHPTMKPVEMLCYLIGNASKRNAIVLDTLGEDASVTKRSGYPKSEVMSHEAVARYHAWCNSLK